MAQRDFKDVWVGYEYSRSYIDRQHVIMRRGGHVRTLHIDGEPATPVDPSHNAWCPYAVLDKVHDGDDAKKMVELLNAGAHGRKSQEPADAD